MEIIQWVVIICYQIEKVFTKILLNLKIGLRIVRKYMLMKQRELFT